MKIEIPQYFLQINQMKLKLYLISLIVCSFSLYSTGQLDSIYVVEKILFLKNGEEIEPNVLPQSSDSIIYSFYSVPSDPNLLLTKIQFKSNLNFTLGYYRKLIFQASDKSYYNSWEKDGVWLYFNSQQTVINQEYYFSGKKVENFPGVILKREGM